MVLPWHFAVDFLAQCQVDPKLKVVGVDEESGVFQGMVTHELLLIFGVLGGSFAKKN